MPTTVTINGVQREVFYELVLDHLSGIADLSLAVERGDFATAERLGIEFGEDLRLMQDLGWDSEPRKDADLTMAPEDLAEVLTRLKADAEGGLSESAYGREAGETDERARDRYRLALDTCDGLLHLIGCHGGSCDERRKRNASAPRPARRPRARLPAKAPQGRPADRDRPRQGPRRQICRCGLQLPCPPGQRRKGPPGDQISSRLRPSGKGAVSGRGRPE